MTYTIETVEDLEKLPIKISYVGETKRDEWECDQWSVEISSAAGSWRTDYFTGLGHRKAKSSAPDFVRINPRSLATEAWRNENVKPVKPSIADVLSALTQDASAADYNFADWCAEYGYSDDSICALNTYKACLEIGAHMRKHFGRDTMEKIAELLQDY